MAGSSSRNCDWRHGNFLSLSIEQLDRSLSVLYFTVKLTCHFLFTLACASLEPNYQPPVTFVVVQKRHHTRLFANNHSDRQTIDMSGNILPGTVVDSKICHPTEFDFYLCRHKSFQLTITCYGMRTSLLPMGSTTSQIISATPMRDALDLLSRPSELQSHALEQVNLSPDFHGIFSAVSSVWIYSSSKLVRYKLDVPTMLKKAENNPTNLTCKVKASLFVVGFFSELSEDFASIVLEVMINMITSSKTTPSLKLVGACRLTCMGTSLSLANRAYKF
ncbi:hypothetical protein C5167_008665 [Papaver somniferum]|uniref:Piwi domain-containing protein n=1 Tax=Papaver somniferum TaxID=3469 RepID=A0A4Y7JV58_PAPSO|nr:hypothetical protein C5167_008665 [Papaver somniferum]